MNVSLTPELERFVDAKVESGLYNNASEADGCVRLTPSAEEHLYSASKRGLASRPGIGHTRG